jgi:hypothetical protein
MNIRQLLHLVIALTEGSEVSPVQHCNGDQMDCSGRYTSKDFLVVAALSLNSFLSPSPTLMFIDFPKIDIFGRISLALPSSL